MRVYYFRATHVCTCVRLCCRGRAIHIIQYSDCFQRVYRFLGGEIVQIRILYTHIRDIRVNRPSWLIALVRPVWVWSGCERSYRKPPLRMSFENEIYDWRGRGTGFFFRNSFYFSYPQDSTTKGIDRVEVPTVARGLVSRSHATVALFFDNRVWKKKMYI